MAKTDQRLIAVLEKLPYCSNCDQDLTQIYYPYLPTCLHLYCLNCINSFTDSGFFTCPLDDICTPQDSVLISRQLCSLTEELVIALDSVKNNSPSEEVLEQLNDIATRMRKEVRCDLVVCKRPNCSLEDCKYRHEIGFNSRPERKSSSELTALQAFGIANALLSPYPPSGQVSEHTDPVQVTPAYFQAVEPIVEVNKQTDFDLIEDEDDRNSEEFEEIGVSGNDLAKSYLDLSASISPNL